MRSPNDVDFWRGFALVTIFVDHIPGIVFENYTFHNFAISDAAELFVFLAGWSLRLLVSSRTRALGTWPLFMRLEGRAMTILIAQIVITEIALGITAAGALYFDNPLILEWNNAAATFQSPVETHVGLMLLSHQLFYFDILPLYVVLMASAPLIVVIHRRFPALLLPASLAIYGLTLTFGYNIPTWPLEGRWFFDPLAWQLVFVLGFLFAGNTGVGEWARKHLSTLRWFAIPIVLIGIVAGFTGFAPDPLSLPQPRLFLMFDKTFESPARVLHLLALIVVCHGLFDLLHRNIPLLGGLLSMLGRNSLYVFCVGSLLSLCGQLARFAFDGTIACDVIVVVIGISVMSATAWLVEWRDRYEAA